MISYCLKCRKDTEKQNPRVSGASNGKGLILSKCAICGSTKSRFNKNLEGKELLSNSGPRTLFSEVPVLGNILF